MSLILFLLIGTVFSIIGAVFLSSRLSLAKKGIAAEAMVIGLKEHYSRSSNRKNRNRTTLTYRPEIEFTTSSGQAVRLVYPSGSNPPKYSLGEKIQIIYSEDNPENMVIDSKSEIILFPIIFIVVGGIFLLAGIGLFFAGPLFK